MNADIIIPDMKEQFERIFEGDNELSQIIRDELNWLGHAE